MSATTRFASAAKDRGFEPDVQTFPAGTRTAADAAAAVGVSIGQIVKSLVFVDGDDPVLILTSGANRVDEAAVAQRAGLSSLKRATAEQVRRATGFAIGGTPPFGHQADITTLLDEDLLGFDLVWAAAGSPEACFPIEPNRLVDLTGARVLSVGEEHED